MIVVVFLSKVSSLFSIGHASIGDSVSSDSTLGFGDSTLGYGFPLVMSGVNLFSEKDHDQSWFMSGFLL